MSSRSASAARRRTWFAVAIAVAALTALGAPVLAADSAVDIEGFAFAPATVTVTVGDTVTWTNRDSAAHTATADDDSFDTGNLGQGASGTVTFDTAGTFAYHCSIHTNMTGSVVVEAAAAPASAAPSVTSPPTDGDDASGGSSTALLAVLAVAVAVIGVGLVARRSARGR